MPYTPILATLGYVMSPDGTKALMIHRNTRQDDYHLGTKVEHDLERFTNIVA